MSVKNPAEYNRLVTDSINKTHADELYHHGVQGMKWGKRNGPPYPLNAQGKAKLAKQKKSSGKKASAQTETGFIKDTEKEVRTGASTIEKMVDKAFVNPVAKKVDSAINKLTGKKDGNGETGNLKYEDFYKDNPEQKKNFETLTKAGYKPDTDSGGDLFKKRVNGVRISIDVGDTELANEKYIKEAMAVEKKIPELKKEITEIAKKDDFIKENNIKIDEWSCYVHNEKIGVLGEIGFWGSDNHYYSQYFNATTGKLDDNRYLMMSG